VNIIQYLIALVQNLFRRLYLLLQRRLTFQVSIQRGTFSQSHSEKRCLFVLYEAGINFSFLKRSVVRRLVCFDHGIEQIIQFHTVELCSAADIITVAARSESLILEFLLDGFEVQILCGV
jgi:hypothetical protein